MKAKIIKSLSPFVYDLSKDQINTAYLQGTIQLKNLILNPEKINQSFEEKNSPIVLKSGLIGLLKIKFNPLRLTSESVKVTVEDLHLVLSPSTSRFDKTGEDFSTNVNDAQFDADNPFANILAMHQKVRARQDRAKAAWKNQHQDIIQERKANAAEERKKAEEKKFKEEQDKKKEANGQKNDDKDDKKKPPKDVFPPTLGFIWNILNGVKLQINRVHVRFEDDYFNNHRPFSCGLMIDQLSFGNTDSAWDFLSPYVCQFKRTKNQTVNKELNLVRLRVYYNSYSEQVIPYNLFEATKGVKYGIFSALTPNEVKELMMHGFGSDEQSEQKMHFLVEPIYLNLALNLNDQYNPNVPYHRFKYQVNILLSKIRLHLTPDTVKDIFQMKTLMETHSYGQELKRFRPLIRMQTFIDARKKAKDQRLTSDVEKRRKACVRGWWQMVLWYVRLRKASTGKIPYDLLEIELALLKKQPQQAINQMRNSRVPKPYEPYYGDSEDEDFMIVDIIDPSQSQDKILDANLDDQDEEMQELEQQFDFAELHNELGDLFGQGKERYQKDKQGLRNFLNGCQLSLRLEGFHIKMAVPGYTDPHSDQFIQNHRMMVNRNIVPSIEVIIDNFIVTARVRDENIELLVTLNKIKVFSNEERDHLATMENNPFYSLQESDDGAYNRRSTIANQFGSRGTMSASSSSAHLQNPSRAANRDSVAQFLSPDRAQRPSTAFGGSDPRSGSAAAFRNSANQGPAPTMHHERLRKESQDVLNDSNSPIEKRCFVLFTGVEDVPEKHALEVRCKINAFKDTAAKRDVQAVVSLGLFAVELNTSIVESLTQALPQFRALFKYGDLAPCRPKLEKRIQMQLCFYLAGRYKNLLTQFETKEKDLQRQKTIDNTYNEMKAEKKKKKAEEEEVKTTRETIKALKGADKALEAINLFFRVDLPNVNVGITGNRSDKYIQNNALINIGLQDQMIVVQKKDHMFKANILGATMQANYNFQILFRFFKKFQQVLSMHVDEFAIQTSMEHYQNMLNAQSEEFKLNEQRRAHEQQRKQQQQQKQPTFKKDINSGGGPMGPKGMTKNKPMSTQPMLGK